MPLATLHEMLAQSAQKFQDRPAFKVKKHGRFVSINYKELYLKLRGYVIHQRYKKAIDTICVK